jgi:hypothetical protein
LDIEPEYMTGVYSDPHHIIEYSDGEIRQEFSVCFACKIIKGDLHVSSESFELKFFTIKELEALDMHESTRVRIKHYLENRNKPVIA